MLSERKKTALNVKYNEIMAKFFVQGFINCIKYLPDACLVYVDEFKKGYKKHDGTVVDDKYLSWRVIYKGYFKKYISSHFSNGMLVDVMAEIMPYAVEKDKVVDGYSCIGKTIDVASYPKYTVKMEKKMIKESADVGGEQPDLDSYNTPDF